MSNTRQKAAPAAKSGWAAVGLAAVNKAKALSEQQQKSRESQRVWRFKLDYNSEAEIVILNKSFDGPEGLFAIQEHELWNVTPDQKGAIYETSPLTEGVEDPLTTHPVINGKTSQPYYVGFLSILDLRPITSKKDPSVTYPYTRMLLPLKGKNQIDQFRELCNKIIKKHGTLRGFYLKMVRPSKESGISARIGSPQVLDNDEYMMEYGFLTEDELTKRFGHPAIKNKEGKEVEAANSKLQAFDCYTLFKKPDPADIRARYGIGAPVGSKEDAEQVWADVLEQDFSADAPENDAQEVDDSELIDFTK